MSEGIGYALGAMLLYGLADYVYKRGASAGAPPHQFLMVQTWFFSSLALLYGLVSGTLAFNAGALWGAVAGVLVVVGYYNFARSLKSGAVSTHATIFRLSFAVTVALAVLVLGEPLTAPKLAGLALVLAAVWLLLAAPGAASGDAHRERRSSLARVLVATVAVGIASFTYKLGLREGATPIRPRSRLTSIAASGLRGRRGATRPSPRRCWWSLSRASRKAWRMEKRAWWCRSRKWDSS